MSEKVAKVFGSDSDDEVLIILFFNLASSFSKNTLNVIGYELNLRNNSIHRNLKKNSK